MRLSDYPKSLSATVLLSILLVGGVVALFMYIVNIQTRIIEAAALENARLYTDALVEFRTLYTSEVVAKVAAHADFSVTHDYQNDKYAIPLPATLSMELGRRIGEHQSGAETHLYSAYPFPWRIETGGLNEPFRQQAWQALNHEPTQAFYQFTQYKGNPVLRYAVADLMRPSCVQCHNEHPDTPKTGWQVNDVRGVLEVIHPLDKIRLQTRDSTQNLFWFAGITALFGALCLYLFVSRHKQNTATLEKLVEVATAEVKDTQIQLAKAEKMASLGELTSSIAHEINQPLGAIILSAEGLDRKVEKGHFDNVTNYTHRIVQQVRRIDGIIKQLSLIGRSSALVTVERIDLNQLLGNAVIQLQDEFEAASIHVEQKLCQDKIWINATELELERAFINILSNAQQAVAQNTVEKYIGITTSVSNQLATIKITNNGSQIPAKLRDKIFEPFFTTKEPGEGTGLGLAMCYGIIHNLKGEIVLADSSSMETTFEITLPIAQQQADQT